MEQFAEDFGFDLDEEGHPLEDDDDEPRSQLTVAAARTARGSDDDSPDFARRRLTKAEREAVAGAAGA